MFKALFLTIFAFTLLFPKVTDGSNNQLLRQGNKLFEIDDFVGAEQKFRSFLEVEPDNMKAWYNLGNTLYRQGRLEEASEIFNRLTQDASAPAELKAAGWHNLGNSLLGSGQVPESVDAFKEALRLVPNDDDTRYNLAYALNLLEDPPPDTSEQDGNGDGDGDDQQDKDQSPDQDDGDDDQNGDTSPERQPDMGDDQLAERPEQLSRQDAERILEALRQQEQRIQEEINREEQTLEPVRSQREW